MDKMTPAAKSYLHDTRGANMVEYIILVGVLALLALGPFYKFGHSTSNKAIYQSKTVSGVNDGQ